jgi:hypothetical protein
MKVVQIARRRDPEIGEVLRYLMARWDRGELIGLVVSAKVLPKDEELSFTGCYKDDPALALTAAFRLSMLLNGMGR